MLTRWLGICVRVKTGDALPENSADSPSPQPLAQRSKARVLTGAREGLEMSETCQVSRTSTLTAFSSCDKPGVTFTFPSVPSEELILTSQKGDGGELPCRNVGLVLQALVFQEKPET